MDAILRPGSRIGRYEVVRPLGIGGMAEVYLARATGEAGFVRTVAIKRLLPHVTENPEMTEMFIDEARISAALHHSNIAQIYDFGRTDDGSYYLAMEYVRGASLAAVFSALALKAELVSPTVAAYVAAALCAALEHAHAKCDERGKKLQIVHRDVKPANVLLSTEGHVKLIDFGIAHATQRVHHTVGQKIKGSLSFMSPEQARAEQVDYRSDIFSAGMVFYVMLAGVNPLQGDTDVDTIERVRQARIVPPSTHAAVPAQLEKICMRALAREREHRYPSAGAMQADLEQYCHAQRFGSRDMAQWMQKHWPADAQPEPEPRAHDVVVQSGHAGGDALDEIETNAREPSSGPSHPSTAITTSRAAEAGASSTAAGPLEQRETARSQPAVGGGAKVAPDAATVMLDQPSGRDRASSNLEDTLDDEALIETFKRGEGRPAWIGEAEPRRRSARTRLLIIALLAVAAIGGGVVIGLGPGGERRRRVTTLVGGPERDAGVAATRAARAGMADAERPDGGPATASEPDATAATGLAGAAAHDTVRSPYVPALHGPRATARTKRRDARRRRDGAGARRRQQPPAQDESASDPLGDKGVKW